MHMWAFQLEYKDVHANTLSLDLCGLVLASLTNFYTLHVETVTHRQERTDCGQMKALY